MSYFMMSYLSPQNVEGFLLVEEPPNPIGFHISRELQILARHHARIRPILVEVPIPQKLLTLIGLRLMKAPPRWFFHTRLNHNHS